MMLEPQPTKRQALAHRMKNLILSGRYTGKLPSERTLAEELGVSRGTVNMALNELLSQGLLERHRGQGTFVPEAVAEWRSGRSHIGKIIHVLFHDRPQVWAGRGWAGQILHVLEQAARPRGIMLAYHGLMPDDPDAFNDVLARVHMNQDAIGICTASVQIEANAAFRLMETGLPFALIEYRLPDMKVNSVMFDGFEGGRLAAEHLADLGHRRLAFVSAGPFQLLSRSERLAGFRSALLARGIEPPNEFSIENVDRLDVEAVRTFMNTARPTGLFCASDKTAAMVLIALAEFGLRVPEDVSVVGFGDDMMGLAEPLQLTCLGGDIGAIGRQCIELLLDEHALTRPKTVVLPVHLVRRKTSGPAPGR